MHMKVLYLRPAGLRAGFGPFMLVNPGSRRQTVKKRHFCQPVTTYFLPDRGKTGNIIEKLLTGARNQCCMRFPKSCSAMKRRQNMTAKQKFMQIISATSCILLLAHPVFAANYSETNVTKGTSILNAFFL